MSNTRALKRERGRGRVCWSIHRAVYQSLFGNDGPFPWVNCTVANRKFRPRRIFVGDYSPRASKIRDDETKHRAESCSDGRLAGRSGHGRFQNSDETPQLAARNGRFSPEELTPGFSAGTHRFIQNLAR